MKRRTSLVLPTALFFGGCASPQNGENSWSGGAYHERLTDIEFLLHAQMGGGYGPSRLRAAILNRAKKLATDGGYKGFIVESPLVTQGQAYRASSRVRLVNAPMPTRPDSEYFEVTDMAPLVAPDEGQSKDFPTLTGSGIELHGSRALRVDPGYFDAVASDGGFATAFKFTLRPVRQLIVLNVSYKSSLLTPWQQISVPILLTLESRKGYRCGGKIDGATISAWIEEGVGGSKTHEVRLRAPS